jgi:ATP-dependent helicase HrpA
LAPGFVAAAGRARLADLTRYAAAIRRRLEQLPHGIAADRQRMAQVHAVQDAYDDLLAALPAIRRVAADVRDIGWQIEELRVSLWAQQLGTPRPVSEKRIYRAIDTAG